MLWKDSKQKMGSALFQWILSSIASMVVGIVWYNEAVFGRLWWKYQFPHAVFGDTSKMRRSNLCFSMTMVAVFLQNGALVLSINLLLPLLANYSPDLIVGVKFPLLLTAIIACVCATSSLCHYLYGNKPMELFCICSGHDTVQLAVAVFTAYMLTT